MPGRLVVEGASSSLSLPPHSPRSNSPAHKYYLATNPVSSAVYLSDTSSRKVFKVKSLRVVKDVAKNLELVAGTGDQCLPYDDARCGDGGKAVEATLTNPRGWLCLVLISPPSLIGVKMCENHLGIFFFLELLPFRA